MSLTALPFCLCQFYEQDTLELPEYLDKAEGFSLI